MRRPLLFIAFTLLALVLFQYAQAQGCAMCTKTAGQLGDKAAKGLNKGILYLAFLPLGMMGIVLYLWLKSQCSRPS